MMPEGIKLFTGNSNKLLAKEIADVLGVPLGDNVVSNFSDGEIMVQINDNVRGYDIFVVQSTCTPVNNNLMELLIMIDALKRASAGRITAVIPYYGYARQDRKVASRVPISARLVADLLTATGVGRVLTIGGVERARAFAKRLNASLAIIDKRREKANISKVMHVIGEVSGMDAILFDDMIDTAGTITQAAVALKENGAKRVIAACSHAVLSGPAIQRINDSELEDVIVTNTIPMEEKQKECEKLTVLSVAPLLGEAIKRINEETSVSSYLLRLIKGLRSARGEPEA
jgi:ribose-phosphate pyrophosphokinase